MADAQADWSTESNDAVHISLVAPATGGLKTLHTFNPKMSYSIFGDEERIFGYQGLKINLKYNASDMRPGLQISYIKRFKTVGETEPTDLNGILQNFLPKTAFEKPGIFEAAISDESCANWKPPGELWKTAEAGGQTYEIWRGSLADLAVQQIVKRIQILVPFFIEGGTFIELKDPEWSLERWTVFFLYQKRSGVESGVSPYLFIGYSTVYRYFYYQSPSNPTSGALKKQQGSAVDFRLPVSDYSFSSLPCRSRISQFIILPPFHGGGHGSRLYNAIFDYYLQEPQTLEITLEDPNEAFDDLRDVNDLARLRTLPDYVALRINANAAPQAHGPVPKDIVDEVKLERIRKRMKIAPRQFYRVTEMQLLSSIPTSLRLSVLPETSISKQSEDKEKERQYDLWQLWVKKRLYKHNKDSLTQLEASERKEKLDEALGAVELDYDRLLRALDHRTKGKASNGSGDPLGKRTTPDDQMGNGEPLAKRAKFGE